MSVVHAIVRVRSLSLLVAHFFNQPSQYTTSPSLHVLFLRFSLIDNDACFFSTALVTHQFLYLQAPATSNKPNFYDPSYIVVNASPWVIRRGAYDT